MILLLQSLFAFNTMAQQWVEVVYLKNGGRIRGTVIEQVPNESLKIQTADGSVFVYKMSEVEKITKEQSRPMRKYQPVNNSGVTNQRQNRSSAAEFQEPYQGREKEWKVSTNIGIGISPNEWVDDMSIMDIINNSVPSEYASLFSSGKRLGLTMHGGLTYERYFNPDSPWFWSLGGFVEMSKSGGNVFVYGSKVLSFDGTLWNYAAEAGLGKQTSPNTEGLHFYWKAGASFGKVSIGDMGVHGYGEAAEIDYSMEDLGYEDMKGQGGFYGRPYAEIGLGGDSFFKMGIRYSPLIARDFYLWSHAVTLSITCPLH